MAEATGQPELVVSIDFGMTCTGVAYCNVATGSDNVRHIQRWPGRTQANENKVPTLLVYPQGSTSPSSWGFLAETAQEISGAGYESREWFKIMLDEHLLEQMRQKSSDPSSVPQIYEVEKWYTDYFQYLYRTIEMRLKGELANQWGDAKIEFIFSVPTTWKPIPTVERFRKIISLSGFGSFPSHSVAIGLTEAEAAAVDTARTMPGIFKENELLFVCDVGGGTTDLAVFKVKNTLGGALELEQIDVVLGATIGAAQLDSLYEKTVLERLQYADHSLPMGLADLNQTAWKMRISEEYQNAKCDYGSEETAADTDTFGVSVPELDRSYKNPQYGIDNGGMYFRRDELKGFFDVQLSKLFDVIDKQLTRIQQKQPSEQISHLVLSGGLGNSAYIQSCLRNRYASGNTSHSNARSMQIRVAPDPQLVVCKGNVANRVKKIRTGQSVLGWRCSRASYGTMCKILYDSENPAHYGLSTKRDALDGKLYVDNCIDWFIKQGEPVSSDHPVVRSFNRKCAPATPLAPSPTRVFPTEIVSSDVEKSQLPMVFSSSCRKICKVESDFSAIPLSTFKLKNRHWWNSGPKYHRINFVVKVNLGPADVSFELWHNGIKLSKENSIKVEWQPAAPPAHDPNDLAADFPMSSLPSAHRKGMAVLNRRSQNNHLGAQQVQSSLDVNAHVNGYGGGQWENKAGVYTHTSQVNQKGSAIW